MIGKHAPNQNRRLVPVVEVNTEEENLNDDTSKHELMLGIYDPHGVEVSLWLAGATDRAACEFILSPEAALNLRDRLGAWLREHEPSKDQFGSSLAIWIGEHKLTPDEALLAARVAEWARRWPY